MPRVRKSKPRVAPAQSDNVQPPEVKTSDIKQSPPPAPAPVMSHADFVDDVEPAKKFQNLWFIADCKLSPKMREQLIENYSNIRSFNMRLFANRSPQVLRDDFNVEHMWTNISDANAREYVRQFIKGNSAFTTVLVRRCVKNAKSQRWIKELNDVEGAIDVSMRVKDLNRIESLTMDGLVDQLEQSITLTAPGSTIGLLTACTRSLLKKRP
jgi:hypothetical protein